MPNRPVALRDILAARQRIAAHVRRTPLVPSAWLSEICGAPLQLKLETLQVTHSFKARGALNAVTRLVQAQGRHVTIVTASAGNHGRAIAWAAERLGVRAIVFTPRSAPETKTRAIRTHGADLRDEAHDYEDAERSAQRHAHDSAAVFISPYDHPDVIAGAGTIALELMEDFPDVETVVVPVGGGGLVSGIAVAMKAISPAVEIVGAEVEASCAFSATRAAGRHVRIEVGETIADGLGGNVDPASITWPLVRDLVDRIVVVPEASLARGIRQLVAEDHLVAEGAAGAAVAAAAGPADLRGRRTAVLLTGANIDDVRLRHILRDEDGS